MADYVLEGVKWESTTLTWSFAIDNYFGQASWAPVTNTFYAVDPVFVADVIWAFERWADVSGLEFVQTDDSASVDIRLGWAVIDGAGGTVGVASYNYSLDGWYLSNNVIVFDSIETWALGSDGDYHVVNAAGVSFRAIALHEIGHMLGLDHYNAELAIMNSFLSGNLDDLTVHDINGIQALYGTGDGGSLNAVYRFYDYQTGDHFYTIAENEAVSIQQNLAARYSYEGVQWYTPDDDGTTIDVYRFFDTSTGVHFFTTSLHERDYIISTNSSYQYEGVAFEAYASAGGDDHVTLERFFNTITGLHHFSANAVETAWILEGGAGAGWVDEGPGFTVHGVV